MDLDACLAAVDTALQDADATLTTELADHHEVTQARLWRGQVLVDWEADARAGGCLLRPALLRRLTALRASVTLSPDGVVVSAPGRIVSALSSEHADLVRRIGGARRVELQLRLRFVGGMYAGGEETYCVVDRGQRLPLLGLHVEVRVRPAPTGSPHTSRVTS